MGLPIDAVYTESPTATIFVGLPVMRGSLGSGSMDISKKIESWLQEKNKSPERRIRRGSFKMPDFETTALDFRINVFLSPVVIPLHFLVKNDSAPKG
jgi:hypothetical protein